MTLPILFLGTAFVILLAFEAGLRFGRWRSHLPDPEPPLPARMIISSVLGLLAFILGFTFGLAASHFDSRSQALDDEAIAIATAYHRADLLSEPARTKVRDSLRKYVDMRIEASRSANVDEVIARLRQLQEEIWSQAIAAGKDAGSPQSPSPLIQSLTEVIDVHGEHVLTKMRSRIPLAVWVILYAITILSIAAAGYHSGLAGNRGGSFAALAYALVFAAVIMMIADLDIPKTGQFQSSYQGLTELRDRLESSRP